MSKKQRITIGSETILNFIQNTIQKWDNVKDDILDKIKYELVQEKVETLDIPSKIEIIDRTTQGFYYERLWDICIKFGVTDITMPVLNGKLQTSHNIDKNPNIDDIEFKENCWDSNILNKIPDGYLFQPVRSGNSGGYSDITFINKIDKEEELYFISVKYFKEEKEINEYDLGKLCSLISKHKQINRNIKVCIFVKDKNKAIEKFKKQHSSSNILIKYINPNGNYENIYDLTDLQNAYFKLKKVLEQFNYLKTDENIKDFQLKYLNVLKKTFIPRFHQKLFISKIHKLIENEEKNILVGAIPRSGKSYIMAGTIIEYVKNNPDKKLNFLIMTPAPNETFNEYSNIFNNYGDFDFFNIGIIIYKDIINKKELSKKNFNIIIVSKQKLGWHPSSKAEQLLMEDANEDEEVKDEGTDELNKINRRITTLFGKINIDIMFLDEAHFGMSTEKAQQIVNVLDSIITRTIKVYVTATYNKPLQAYGVNKDSRITWDMNDIKIMQTLTKDTINKNDIKTQFGTDIYNETLKYYGDESGISLIDKLKKEYLIYPKPYLITSLWDKEFLNTEKLKIGNSEFGWDMNKLFATKSSDSFENVEQIKEMMCYYFGYPDKTEDYIKQSFYRKRGILPRIKNICLNRCRTLQPQHKTTQLWFLPLGNGIIKHKISALINLLKGNEFKDINNNYHFFVAVEIDKLKGQTKDNVTYMNNPHKIKDDIENVEKLIQNGKISKDNLIILAGQRLQLGISLRNVDIVTMWNSISSTDAIFQMLFRSMTEVDNGQCIDNEYCPQKKFGFMVDMNPQRSLINVNLFNENIDKVNSEDRQKYKQITDLINIDEDVLFDKYGDDEQAKEQFVKELMDKLKKSWNINLDNIKKSISNLSFNMEKLKTLKDVFNKIYITKTQKENMANNVEQFKSGKKKEKIGKGTKKKKEEKELNINEIAVEVLSEFISLLNIFTLYTDSGSKCVLISKEHTQITIINDIEYLKNEIYKDIEKKNSFLLILNGRLTGNPDDPFPEEVIEVILSSINSMSDKLTIEKIIDTQKKQYYTIDEPDKLLEFINKELKPKEKERKENGEVFTPLSLVNEMMDKLDESYIKENGKSIFTEPTFKWLDPSVGIGNFPIIVYQRLMKGLIIQFPNEEDRRRHILEEMIYSAELTPKNVFIYKKILCGDKYKLNIYEGDTLKMVVKKEFKLPADFSGFDVVMGNPPFQEKVGPNKTETLWGKFIIKSLTLLKSSGYLVFVHPSGWRNIDGKFKNIQNEILTRDLQYLEIHNEKDGLKTFSSETRYDWYVLKNELVDNTNTIIKFQDGTTNTINVNGLEFIPNGEYEKIMSMIAKNGEENVDVIYERSLYGTDKKHMSKTKTEEYKYPCVYTVNSKSEPSFFYSSIKHGQFGVPKFIWSNGRISSIGSYVDINGDYGLTQFAYAIVDKPENLPKIKEVFDSKDFRNLMELCAVGQLTVNYKVISIFKKDFWKIFLNKNEKIIEPSINSTVSNNSSISVTTKTKKNLLKSLVKSRRNKGSDKGSNGLSYIERKKRNK